MQALLFIWGALLTLAALGLRGSGSLVALLAGWLPMGLMLWMRYRGAARHQASHEALLVAAGITPGAGFDHVEAGTGIAINPRAKTLVLIVRGAAKTYAYADVREWTAREERSGGVVPNTLVGAMVATRMDMDAKANTGLYVTVRDVDHPQWRISMKAEKQRLRWMEILRQELNEGGVAMAAAR